MTIKLAAQLGKRLNELRVTELVEALPHRMHQIRHCGAVLVVTDAKYNGLKPLQWGIAKPDMPYHIFLAEIFPPCEKS